MVADETALILVQANDTAETVHQQLLRSGARQAQLLVPEGVAGLQQPAQLEHLRALAAGAAIGLIVISSDPATISAARLSRIETLQVRDARVTIPSVSPYATRALPRPPVTPRGGVSRQIAADLSAGDAAFLDALDDLDAAPRAPAGPAAEDEDLFAALEGLSAALDAPPARSAPSADDDFVDSLDSIGADEDALRRPSAARAATPAAPQRIRPEDIQLSAEEKSRAGQTGRYSGATLKRPAAQPTPARRPDPLDDDLAEPARPRRSWLIPAVVVAVVLLLAALAGLLFLGNGATVVVRPPVRPDQIEPVSELPIPLAAPGSGGSAVEAEAIVSSVAITVSGSVAEGTLSPAGTARGSVTILSLNPQPITLPAGSEFIAVKPDGQEVPFISSAEVVVPAATTSDQGAQIVTVRGQVALELTARSPGSASNIDANSIRRIVLPGGQTFNVDSGALLVRHDPISGGSEEQVRIVKDSDVQALLGQALAALDSQARQQLTALAATRSLAFEPTTIRPRPADLQQLTGYEASVSPAVGETVDQNNPSFTLTVQAQYSSLATPQGKPLKEQLQPALTEQLSQAGKLQIGDCKAPAITYWRWDGQRLTVSGQIGPKSGDPACGPGLSAAALDQVRAAVRGKTRAEAEAALAALVQQGLIGSYTLPDVDRLPGLDFQLRVEAR
jgi:hypothetical protein